MAENEKNAKRLTALETSLMHLQNDFDSLNDAVLKNAQRLDLMAKSIQVLSDRLRAASEPVSERSAEDEIPPHY